MKSLLILVISIVITLFGAYVYSLIWLWYVIPLFSVPKLSVGFIFIFIYVYSAIRIDSFSILKSKDRSTEDVTYIMSFTFINYLFILLLGWLLTL